MKTQSISTKPWLDQNGLPLCDSKLKLVSKRWDQKTWDEYLSWFECPRRESLIKTSAYQEALDKMEESIFSLATSEESNNSKVCVDEFLAMLTPKQKIVIEMTYWQNKSEREIAKHLGVSRGTIRDIKKNALTKIKKNFESANTALKTNS